MGIFQCLSMVPGTSRSGATTLGAMVLGVDRKTAAEYSFLLAIPTMFAATSYELYQARHELTSDGAIIIAIGFCCLLCFGVVRCPRILGVLLEARVCPIRLVPHRTGYHHADNTLAPLMTVLPFVGSTASHRTG